MQIDAIPSIPAIPALPPGKLRSYEPSREDQVRQARMSGARYQRVQFKIKVRAGYEACNLPGGYVLPSGEHMIAVPENEVDALLAQVETREHDLASAKEEFDRHIREECALANPDWQASTTTEAERQQSYKTAMARTGKSVQAFFSDRAKRGILPLESAERVSVLPPVELDTDANLSQVAAIAGAAAREAVGAVMAQQPQSNGGNNNKR